MAGALTGDPEGSPVASAGLMSAGLDLSVWRLRQTVIQVIIRSTVDALVCGGRVVIPSGVAWRVLAR
jgi:hypothetical protein